MATTTTNDFQRPSFHHPTRVAPNRAWSPSSRAEHPRAHGCGHRGADRDHQSGHRGDATVTTIDAAHARRVAPVVRRVPATRRGPAGRPARPGRSCRAGLVDAAARALMRNVPSQRAGLQPSPDWAGRNLDRQTPLHMRLSGAVQHRPLTVLIGRERHYSGSAGITSIRNNSRPPTPTPTLMAMAAGSDQAVCSND